jgi:drug/metabolite transporter (DMT)-like permease
MGKTYPRRQPFPCHTPGVLLGLSAALLAAVLFGIIAVVQAAVIRRRGLFSPMVLGVLAAYLVGWLLHLVAIAQLPLYLAQVGVGASLVVTALVASFVMGEPLLPRHWAAVAAMAFGLGLLAAAAGSVGSSDFASKTTVVLYVLLVLNALLGWLAWRWQSPWSGVALGILAGTAYGGSPIATRSLVDPTLDLNTIAPALSIGMFGALGFVLYSVAMKRTSVTAATAPLVLLQTVIPAVVGLATFGDEVRDGWWPAALVAFAVSVSAGVVLCGAEAKLDLLDGPVADDDVQATQPS